MSEPDESNVKPRFRDAILAARQLPPDLLMHSQKLKLYALFHQSQGPAPAELAAASGELAQAKWEAWNDVRALSTVQAMDSYSTIIEGLVAMLEAEGGGRPAAEAPAKPPTGRPALRPRDGETPAAQPSRPASRPPRAVGGAAAAEAAAAVAAAVAAEDATGEPEVECTKWSTEALDIAAGATFEVPLAVSEPSRVRYEFSVPSGHAVGLGIEGPAASGPAVATLLTRYESEGAGTFDVGASGLVRATFDNSASMITSVTVRVIVRIEPLAQLAAREAHRARAALRAELAERQHALALRASEHERLLEEAEDLLELKKELLHQLSSVTQRLDLKSAEIEGVEEGTAAIHAQVSEVVLELQRVAP